MAFYGDIERLKGNQLWRLRTKHGKDRIFGDASVLLAEACAYFDWCDRHPQHSVELVKYQGMADEAEVPLGRPYTIMGLTSYLNVSKRYFYQARTTITEKIEKGKATPAEVELLEAIEWIEQTIVNQQIEGAMVGIFNPGLTARLNGISDTINNVSTGETVLRVSVRDQKTADHMEELENLL